MSSRSIETNSSQPHAGLAALLLQCATKGMVCGRLLIETPQGAVLEFSGGRPGQHACLKINSWGLLWRLALGADVGFAEGYLAGEWSSLDLPALLRFLCLNANIGAPLRALRLPAAIGRLHHGSNRNTRRGSRRNIAAHYDLGNAFYAQWLDPDMNYSSGLYSADSQTLLDAQRAKLDRVAELLGLSGGERVLEIGCGWGALAERLAERHGSTVTGITLSCEQLTYARDRLSRSSARDRCEFHLQDYRDTDGTYDRIASIEMLEAVGEEYWPVYFDTLRARLKRDGIAVLQIITIGESHFESYRRNPDFIQRYIFPGGMLPTAGIIAERARNAGLQVVSQEFFGDSYARTLADWRLRFKKSWPSIESMGFDARFKRMWDYYLAYCQAGFEAGVLNVCLYKISRAR